MNQPTPIRCPKCSTVVVADMQNLSGYVMPSSGIKCPACQETVVYGSATLC